MSTLRKALNHIVLINGANWPLGALNLVSATWKFGTGAGVGMVGYRDADEVAVDDGGWDADGGAVDDDGWDTDGGGRRMTQSMLRMRRQETRCETATQMTRRQESLSSANEMAPAKRLRQSVLLARFHRPE